MWKILQRRREEEEVVKLGFVVVLLFILPGLFLSFSVVLCTSAFLCNAKDYYHLLLLSLENSATVNYVMRCFESLGNDDECRRQLERHIRCVTLVVGCER